MHTNFNLRAGGEYLALVQPDELTIVSEFSPEFPPQAEDISFGLPTGGDKAVLVDDGSSAFYLVPTDGALGTSWTEVGFVEDLSWTIGTVGVGFDTNVGSPNLVARWALDESPGASTVFDSTGSGYNGLAGGGVTFGGAGANVNTETSANFSGASGIDVSHDAGLNTPSFTYTTWAKPTGGSGHRAVVTTGLRGTGNSDCR